MSSSSLLRKSHIAGICLLTNKLEQLPIKELAGENIYVACSLIRGLADHLKMVKKLPQDVETLWLRISCKLCLLTSSKLCLNFFNMKLMRLMTTKSAVKETLALAEQCYAEMLAEPSMKWSCVGWIGCIAS
jgi:hypothetical protein